MPKIMVESKNLKEDSSDVTSKYKFENSVLNINFSYFTGDLKVLIKYLIQTRSLKLIVMG